MKNQNDDRLFKWVTVGSILMVFLAAGVMIAYAFHRSAEHYTPAALREQVSQAASAAVR